MNVLQVNKFYYMKGGAERYYFELSKLLKKNGHKVIPFAVQSEKNLKSEYSKYFVSEIRTKPSWNVWQNFRTIFRFWWSLEAQRKLKKLIAENKIDVAHIHNIYHQISPSILPVLKKNNIPVVMTVHDYSLVSPNYNLFLNGGIYDKVCGKKYWKCLIDRCVNKSFVQSLIAVKEMYWHHKILKVYEKNIDMFIAPSEFVKKKLIKGGLDKNKIKVIPHFVNFEDYKNIKAGESKEKYILYFGRLSAEKGIQILVKAMKELPGVNLKVVGDGDKNFQFSIFNYQLKNVEFLGFKENEELQEIILGSQFVVVPSIAPETFGLSALEAMSLGKCVLASRTGALPELINEKCLFESGNVKELVEKIKYLTKNENYAKIRGQENKKLVEFNYGENKHFKRIFNVYSTIISKRN